MKTYQKQDLDKDVKQTINELEDAYNVALTVAEEEGRAIIIIAFKNGRVEFADMGDWELDSKYKFMVEIRKAVKKEVLR